LEENGCVTEEGGGNGDGDYLIEEGE